MSLAIAIACSSVSYGRMQSTGPKISSTAMVMSLRTSAKTVGLHIVAAVEAVGTAEAAGDERRAFIDALLDEALDLVPLGFGDDRADGALLGGRRVLHLHGFGGRLGDGLGFFLLGARHEHARGRVAALARVGHHLHDAGLHGLREVGVIEHDVGRLAAEFLRDALHGRRSGLRDQHAGAGRAGERHHVDIGVRRERCANAGAIAVDEVEHALAARRLHA